MYISRYVSIHQNHAWGCRRGREYCAKYCLTLFFRSFRLCSFKHCKVAPCFCGSYLCPSLLCGLLLPPTLRFKLVFVLFLLCNYNSVCIILKTTHNTIIIVYKYKNMCSYVWYVCMPMDSCVCRIHFYSYISGG